MKGRVLSGEEGGILLKADHTGNSVLSQQRTCSHVPQIEEPALRECGESVAVTSLTSETSQHSSHSVKETDQGSAWLV